MVRDQCNYFKPTFPEDGAPLPSVEVDQHREEGDGRGVIPPGLHIDLALSPEDGEWVTHNVLRQKPRQPDPYPGVLVRLLLPGLLTLPELPLPGVGLQADVDRPPRVPLNIFLV